MFDVDLLVSEIVCDRKEDEVVFRDGKCFINCFIRVNVYDKKIVINIQIMFLFGKICFCD